MRLAHLRMKVPRAVEAQGQAVAAPCPPADPAPSSAPPSLGALRAPGLPSANPLNSVVLSPGSSLENTERFLKTGCLGPTPLTQNLWWGRFSMGIC